MNINAGQTDYTVRRGDTLSAIAKRFDVSVDDLARANHIRNINHIDVGQILVIPKKKGVEGGGVPYGVLLFEFIDAVGQPISDMGIEVQVGGQTLQCKSDFEGRIPPILVDEPHAQAIVHVHRWGGGSKKVAELIVAPSAQHILLQSPKAKFTAQSRIHEGPPQVRPYPIPKAPGTIENTRSESGHPSQCCTAGECPNADNLRLGRNQIYREAILKAARHVGLIPQAISGLIDSEAGKVSHRVELQMGNGKPRLRADGKPMTRMVISDMWDSNSINRDSHAAGLTQFLPRTWLAHALNPGSYLNGQCKARKWVRAEKGKTLFVLADGQVTSQPWNHRTDPHVQACLQQRLDPEWSIMAAADYGKANLERLRADGFDLSGLNDAEKAKLMYLMHHEGEGNGPRFIRKELSKMPKGGFPSSEARLRNIFGQQVGERAEFLIQRYSGNVQQAYRDWLSSYIDVKFRDLSRYACQKSGALSSRGLLELCLDIGGIGE